MKRPFLLLALALGGLLGVRAEVVSVAVGEWARTGTGKTADGWEVVGIDGASDGSVKIREKGDIAISPLFPGVVTQLVLTVKVSNREAVRLLTAVPLVADGEKRELAVQTCESYAEQSLAWRRDEGVRQFCLRNIGSYTSVWSVRSLDVCLDRVEPPQRMVQDDRYSDALTLAWEPDARAVSHELEVCRVTRVPTQFVLRQAWDFSTLTNTTRSTRDFALLRPSGAFDDVSGTELCLQALAGGHVQIGKSGVAGTMTLPLETRESRTALMTLFRHENDDADGDVSVGCIDAGGETNVLANPVLTVAPTALAVALPDEARFLHLQSRRSRRIRLQEARVVTDYVSGWETTNAVLCRKLGKCGWKGRSMASGEYLWRVRSFDAEGTGSAWSAYRSVTLDPDRPRRPVPGFQLLVR